MENTCLEVEANDSETLPKRNELHPKTHEQTVSISTLEKWQLFESHDFKMRETMQSVVRVVDVSVFGSFQSELEKNTNTKTYMQKHDKVEIKTMIENGVQY